MRGSRGVPRTEGALDVDLAGRLRVRQPRLETGGAIEAEVGHHQIVDVEHARQLGRIVGVDLQPRGARADRVDEDRRLGRARADGVTASSRVPCGVQPPWRRAPSFGVRRRRPVAVASARESPAPRSPPGGTRISRPSRSIVFRCSCLNIRPGIERAGRERLDRDQRRHVAAALVADDQAGAADFRLREDRDLQRGDLGLAVEPLVERLHRQVADVRRQPREQRGQDRQQHREQDRDRPASRGGSCGGAGGVSGDLLALSPHQHADFGPAIRAVWRRSPAQPVSSRIASSVETAT